MTSFICSLLYYPVSVSKYLMQPLVSTYTIYSKGLKNCWPRFFYCNMLLYMSSITKKISRAGTLGEKSLAPNINIFLYAQNCSKSNFPQLFSTILFDTFSALAPEVLILEWWFILQKFFFVQCEFRVIFKFLNFDPLRLI